MTSHRPMTTKRLVIDAFLCAILFISQVSLSWLPNVELVSLFLILYTLVFGRHVWIILYVFVLLEGLFWGIGMWWFSYLYVWALIPASVFLLYKKHCPSPVSAALLAGSFGMLFGLFSSLPAVLTGGLSAAFVWWTAGIPYDILHGMGNFIVSLILFKPLYQLLTALKQHQL
ncbi:hypothetical protein RZO55_19680 [Clostridium boliviensis]|uniref:Energy-coupling factor transport system substrate-specific component n=1 Tax=Clostridium boliviensis TaxID=318465 RepID=A0ABU4GS29_9CLOT|nr:hypothetical protein [Clostridium boliviensis]MDW2799800.1 hypothetical protein [Clostridium boliviensis]